MVVAANQRNLKKEGVISLTLYGSADPIPVTGDR